MTSGKSNESNAVDVDGIGFETVMPERVLFIPAMQPGANTLNIVTSHQEAPTPVEIGIRITNNTQIPVCLSFYGTISPELRMPDGQIKRVGSYFSDWVVQPQNSDFPTVLPGEALTFSPGAALNRHEDDQLQLLVSVGNGGYWIFEALHPGTYQIRFKYQNNAKKLRAYDPALQRNKLIENIWTGVILMPFVEFSILSR